MGLKLELLEIHPKNTNELSLFIKDLGDEQDSFRYFKNRGLEAIKNHIYTFLLLESSISVGYGHLDLEDSVVWLGIVVKKEHQGKGLAKIIMHTLVNKAEELGLKSIQLSVDHDNKIAIALYQKFGFELTKKAERFSIYKKHYFKT